MPHATGAQHTNNSHSKTDGSGSSDHDGPSSSAATGIVVTEEPPPDSSFGLSLTPPPEPVPYLEYAKPILQQQHNIRQQSRSPQKPQGRSTRQWLILVLSAVISFAHYYCYDLPASSMLPLLSYFEHGGMSGDRARLAYSLLYSAYAAPNILLPLLIGRWVDRRSSDCKTPSNSVQKHTFAEKMLVWLTLLLASGHALFVLGLRLHSLPLMFLGRAAFGAGGESISVVQTRLIVVAIADNTNRGEQLASIMAWMSAVAGLGSIVNMHVTPRVISHFGLFPAMLVGVGMGLVVISMALTLIAIRPHNTTTENESESSSDELVVLREPALVRWTRNSPGGRMAVFGALAVITFIFNASIYPYRTISQAYLTRCFYPASKDAGSVALGMSLNDSIAIVLGLSQLFLPPSLFRYVAKPMTVTLAGGLLFTLGHASLFFSALASLPPFPALSILGIAETAVMWSWGVVPSLLPSAYQTTAYGVMTVVANISIFLNAPIANSLLQEDSDVYSDAVDPKVVWGFARVAGFFVALGIAGFVAALGLALLARFARYRLRLQSATADPEASNSGEALNAHSEEFELFENVPKRANPH